MEKCHISVTKKYGEKIPTVLNSGAKHWFPTWWYKVAWRGDFSLKQLFLLLSFALQFSLFRLNQKAKRTFSLTCEIAKIKAIFCFRAKRLCVFFACGRTKCFALDNLVYLYEYEMVTMLITMLHDYWFWLLCYTCSRSTYFCLEA